MNTVLTDEQVESALISAGYVRADFKLTPQALANSRAIEQAVLQSEQVQRWKRDTERIYDIENERILVGPMHQGGWVAYVFKNQDAPVERFNAESFREVVDAAMEKQP